MNISNAYVLPTAANMPFAYTAIDAVYIWTKGGYQVARDPTDYPLFVAVNEDDVDEWIEFFEPFGIPAATERQPVDAFDGAIQVVLYAEYSVEREFVDGRPVIPLADTVTFAEEQYATFEPALEMLDEMYDFGISVETLERNGTANDPPWSTSQ